MLTVEILATITLLLVVPFLAILLRRRALSRGGGAIELSFRLKPRSKGRGWVLGIGRFAGDELQWFRVFSLSPNPRRTMSRCDLQVKARRTPKGAESMSLLKGATVVELRSAQGPVEIALDHSAMTGFLAWLEARPPGATLPA